MTSWGKIPYRQLLVTSSPDGQTYLVSNTYKINEYKWIYTHFYVTNHVDLRYIPSNL